METRHDFTAKTYRDEYFAQLEKELRLLIDPETGKLRKDVSSHIPCPNCGSRQSVNVFEKNGFEFVACALCDLMYTNPQVNRDIILELYKGESGADNLWIKVLQSDEQQKFNRQYYGEVLDMIRTYVSEGKLLDIGCSVGGFMKLAAKRGFVCKGLELNEAASRIATGAGLDVERKTIEQLRPATGEYQIVTMLGVLEHLNNPKEVLTEVYRALEAGGYLFVHVPNLHSLATTVLQEKSKTFDGRNHLIYFSMDTLQHMIESVGFQIVYCDTCLTAADQIRRHMSYGDGKALLNRKVLRLMEDERQLEQVVRQFDLGYRIRALARKN